MVCINKHAQFVREFDAFRRKLGLPTANEAYVVPQTNELVASASRFFISPPDDSADPPGDVWDRR